ncbi:MAG: ABC transporter permease [Spirochaetaceae bacterium]|nr:ABC transporter permease [Spirochaetaceae bacterium]
MLRKVKTAIDLSGFYLSLPFIKKEVCYTYMNLFFVSIHRLGFLIRYHITSFVYFLSFFGKIIRSIKLSHFKDKVFHMHIQEQLLYNFVEALFVVALLGLSLGTVIFLVGYPILVSLGQGQLLYQLLISIILRELGPLLLAFVVIARSATTLSTEISTMIITKEIEAYIAVGLDTVTYLIVPRFLGIIFSLFLLLIYFAFFGLIAPILITNFLGKITFEAYLTGIFQTLSVQTFFISSAKAIIFGIIIGTVSPYYGLKNSEEGKEVAQSSVKAVGISLLLVIASNFVITFFSYALG